MFTCARTIVRMGLAAGFAMTMSCALSQTTTSPAPKPRPRAAHRTNRAIYFRPGQFQKKGPNVHIFMTTAAAGPRARRDKWTELDSVQFGVGRGISSPVGTTSTRENAPSVSEITITRKADAASPKLLKRALGGHSNTVTIVFTHPVNGRERPYMVYELTNAMVSGYNVASAGELPQESLSLNFAKIKMQDLAKNQTGVPRQAAINWDLPAARID